MRWLKHGHCAVLLSWRIYISAVKWRNRARDTAAPEFYRPVKLHISSSSIRPSSVSDFFKNRWYPSTETSASPEIIGRKLRFFGKAARSFDRRESFVAVGSRFFESSRMANSRRTVARESFTIRGAVGDKLCQTYLTFRPLQLYVVQDSSASEYLQNDENLLKRFVGRVSSFQFSAAEQSDRTRFLVFRFPVDARNFV